MDAKGEIILTGATAKMNSTRSDEKKKFHFVVSHPVCGTRELYASSNRHRTMWINRINDIARAVSMVGFTGKILKQGGLMKDTWQERFCHCVGKNLDYFENSSDNQVKGTLDLLGAKIKEFSLKDQKYAFEVQAATPGKKGMKKYTFAVETESERKKWLEVMSAAAIGSNKVVFSTPQDGKTQDTKNPMGSGSDNNKGVDGSQLAGAGGADDDEDVERGSFSISKTRQSSIAKPADKLGILKKRSPALLKSWQVRYFVLKEPGELFYYTDKEEYDNKMKPKGDIQIGDILTNGVTVKGKDIKIALKEREFELQAASDQEAIDWKASIDSWMAYLATEV